MLTYQLQKRIYKLTAPQKLSFPCDAEIILKFAPPEVFGACEGSSTNFALSGHKNRVVMNMNLGRWTCVTKPKLKPLVANLRWQEDLSVELRGNEIHIHGHFETFKTMDGIVQSLHYIIPLLLNLNYPSTTYIKRTSGKAGNCKFGWELQYMPCFLIETDENELEDNIKESFKQLNLFEKRTNTRLLTALHYYYIVRRLLAAGSTPFEFMAEVVLNLNKILEVLFGSEREKVRLNLKRLSYSDNEIEIKFIPIMILRNDFNVGHVFLSTIEHDKLDVLYKYLHFAEEDFRDLLLRIIRKINDGSFKISKVDRLKLDKNHKNTLSTLLRSFRKRSEMPFLNHPKAIKRYEALIE